MATPPEITVEKEKKKKDEEKKKDQSLLERIFFLGSGFIKWSFVICFLLAALFVLFCFADFLFGSSVTLKERFANNDFWNVLNDPQTTEKLLKFLFTKLAPILLLIPFTCSVIFIIIIIVYYALCDIRDEHREMLKRVKSRTWRLIWLIVKVIFDVFTSVLESVQLPADFVKSLIYLSLGYDEDEEEENKGGTEAERDI